MKKFLVLYLALVCLFVTGCGSKEEKSKTNKPMEEEKPKESAYNNTDFDGSYFFDITGDNGSYRFYSKGYLIIKNGECNTDLQFNASQGKAYKTSYKGTCKFDGEKMQILLSDSDETIDKYAYSCLIENKDLNCNIAKDYGMTLNSREENLIFQYKYDLDSWETYRRNQMFYLPDDFKWKISVEELIERYGTSTLYSPAGYNLSWTKPLYANVEFNNTYDDVQYILSDGKVVAYMVDFNDKPSKPYELYQKTKDILVEKYGDPTSEKFIWNDETYKSDQTRWNDAMRYNHLKILTVWKFKNYHLDIEWEYGKSMYVGYSLNGY